MGRRRVIPIFLIVSVSSWLIGAISLPVFAVGRGMMTPALQLLVTMTSAEGVVGAYQSAARLGIIFSSALGGTLSALRSLLCLCATDAGRAGLCYPSIIGTGVHS